MSDFRTFRLFGGRRRRNKKRYRPDCFNAKNYQNCSFERIIFAQFSARRRRNKKIYRLDFLRLKVIIIVFSKGLFTTIVCCLQHVEILTNFVFARHLAKYLIFALFAKFGGRRRRNEKGYRPDCFNAKECQNCFFERII